MRASLLGLAVALLPAAATAQDRITVVPTPGQAVTIVAEPAAAERAPALGALLGPYAARVGLWAGARPPATIFLVADRERVPDPPGPFGELPGAQIDVARGALYLWAGTVPDAGEAPSPAIARVLPTFLVQTAVRQLAGPRPAPIPVWLVLGLLDNASLSPPTPIPGRALTEAPFLALLHPTLNAPFLELLETQPVVGAAVARALVDDLLTRAAPPRLGDLLRALRHDDFGDAFADTYGLSLDAYQEEMARNLAGGQRL